MNLRLKFQIEIGWQATPNAAPTLPAITSNKSQYSRVLVFKYKKWRGARTTKLIFGEIEEMEERTNLPENRFEGQAVVKDNRLEDLAVLSRWVKLELFDTVKFLYKPEVDLRLNGTLFNLFIRDCRDRLVGLKVNSGGNQAYRRMYVESIWSEATTKRNNIITDGLSARRSGVYSAMQNRFIGKCCGRRDNHGAALSSYLLTVCCCRFQILYPLPELCNLCAKGNYILPSLEAFQMRLEIPCVYMIFHEYFLKSSVGDTRWKATCLDAKSLSDPLAPVQGEAFAMITLKNNYFAWLWEAKLNLKKLLVTDYDTESELRNKANVGEALLKKAELNLEQEENDDDDGDAEEVSPSRPRPLPGGSSTATTAAHQDEDQEEPSLRELNYDNILVPESTGNLYRDLKKKPRRSLRRQGGRKEIMRSTRS